MTTISQAKTYNSASERTVGKIENQFGWKFSEITSQLRKYAKIEEEECEFFHFVQNYRKKNASLQKKSNGIIT